MLTPAKDDPNYKIERDRMKKNPGSFGVMLNESAPNLPTSGGLVPAERGKAAASDIEKYDAELKAWATKTVSLPMPELMALIPSAEKLHLEHLISAENTGKKRKTVLDELNAALTKLL